MKSAQHAAELLLIVFVIAVVVVAAIVFYRVLGNDTALIGR